MSSVSNPLLYEERRRDRDSPSAMSQATNPFQGYDEISPPYNSPLPLAYEQISENETFLLKKLRKLRKRKIKKLAVSSAAMIRSRDTAAATGSVDDDRSTAMPPFYQKSLAFFGERISIAEHDPRLVDFAVKRGKVVGASTAAAASSGSSVVPSHDSMREVTQSGIKDPRSRSPYRMAAEISATLSDILDEDDQIAAQSVSSFDTGRRSRDSVGSSSRYRTLHHCMS